MRAICSFAILLFCLALVGCGSAGHKDIDNLSWFSYWKPSEHAILLFFSDYSYELELSEIGMVKKGRFDESTASKLQSLFDLDSIRHYVDSSGQVSEDRCTEEGTKMVFRVYGSGCWVRRDVTDAAVAEMLDYVTALYMTIRAGMGIDGGIS